MKDLLLFVADKNTEFILKGVLGRTEMLNSLGIRDFSFDIQVAVGQNDPGLYVRANSLLKHFRNGYAHVIVICDAEWDGAPSPADIKHRLEQHITDAGWTVPSSGAAIVVEPEIDVWIWASSDSVAKSLGWSSINELQDDLVSAGYWLPGSPKPFRPKEAVERAIRRRRIPRSSSLYAEISSSVSLTRCVDPSANRVVEVLANWFPASV